MAGRKRRTVLTSFALLVGVVAAGLVALLAIGGVFVPATYLEPWSKSYAAKYDDPRMTLVAQALLAPSGHNMQPWIVELDETHADVLYLYADPARLTLAVDPLARQTMVSEGAFLGYLRVAGKHLGYSTDFDLFPDGAYNETDLPKSMTVLPVAKITIAKDAATQTDDHDALFLSDTNRSPYADTALTDIQRSQLLALDGGAATLQLFDTKRDAAAFAAYGNQGTLIETQYAAATAESNAVFSSTETEKNATRSGFAVEGQGTSGFMKYLVQGFITAFPAMNDDASGAQRAIDLTAAGVANTPTYALISTPGNTREEQVEAGILYADFSLHARTLGLVMQPLSQVLQEYPTMAGPHTAIHREYAPDGATLQMLVRIGVPTTEYPVTMRRDADELVRQQ